jgi:TonB-linked SusC/RagA family outer membrane protein
MKKLLLGGVLILGAFSAWSQDLSVSGKVTSKEGEEIPGVNISIKRTTIGTVTQVDGSYRLQVRSSRDTLVFSFIGYVTKEQVVGNRAVINVTLEAETTQLQEVVVTGFQEVERKLFTGSATTVKMADLRAGGMTDASQMLEGRVAGVTVDNVSGTFGTNPKIRIRGNTSINGDTQPLFVVDGVILEDLNQVNADDILTGNANTLTSSSIAGLNPDDIESQQILKDASATALYGARAKNGVIVITTKKGKSGQTKVGYSGNFSFHLRPTYKQFDILNSGDEMSVYRELYEKGLIDVTTSVRAQNYGALGKMFNLISEHELDWGPGGTLNEEFLNQYENANTDWFDVLFNDFSLQQQHSVSFTSGNDKHSSYYSMGYLHDNGQSIADNVKRYSATARNSFFFSDKFSLDVKMTGSFREQRAPGTQNRDFDPITGRFRRDFDINPLSYALNTSRSIRPYDSEGNLEYFRRNYAPFNILEELKLNYINISVTDLSGQVDLNYKVRDNITLRSAVQGRYAVTRREHVIHEKSNQAEAYRADETQYIQDANPLLYDDPNDGSPVPIVVLPVGGFNNLNIDQLRYFYMRNSADWSHSINSVHKITALIGQEIKYTTRNSDRADGIGVVYESGGVVNTSPKMIEFLTGQGITPFGPLVEETERFAGLFLNGGYSYNDKYIFNGTIRYDGSNLLGRTRTARYLPTWNVSGAWNVTSEDFFNVDWINVLKLRATYGLSGNLGPNTSALLTVRSGVTLRPTDVEPFLFIESLKNSDLTWEKLKEFNVGIDFGLFNSKITGTFDAYTRNAFDLIGVIQTSGIGGNPYKSGNYANMESQGIEFAIDSRNLEIGDFSWVTSFNIGYSRDKITKLDFNPRIADAIRQGGAAVLGGPRRGVFSVEFAGLSNGIPTFYNSEGEVVNYFDLQDRENIMSVLKYEGPAEPRGAGGLTNIFSYKNFSLNIFLSYKFDYKIRLDDGFNPRYTDFNSLSRTFVNRWVVPGDEGVTSIPVILDKGVVEGVNPEPLYAYDLYNKSTERVADGTYVRLKTVRLSYIVPGSLARKIKATNASISLEAQNLTLLYSDKKLNGQDPEFFSAGGVALPQPRLFTTSIILGF